MSASLPGVSEPVLLVEPQVLRAVDGGVAQHVARREQRRRAGGQASATGWDGVEISLLEDHLVHDHALHVHGGRASG